MPYNSLAVTLYNLLLLPLAQIAMFLISNPSISEFLHLKLNAFLQLTFSLILFLFDLC
jgi:hypothetical protein